MTVTERVTVAELRRAWLAVGAGEYADRPTSPSLGSSMSSVWMPAEGERVLPVIGAHGSAGASTVALAIATVAGPARVVECAPTSHSGLVGAATAELGLQDGWLRGSRDDVIVERWADGVRYTVPLTTGLMTTVLDAGAVLQLVGPDSNGSPAWLSATVHTAPAVVVVGVVSLTGVRRVLHTVAALGRSRCVVALRGPRLQRCPRYLRRAVDELDDFAAVVQVSDDPVLRLRGIDTSPLPRPLLAAAEQILTVADQAWRKETP